MKTLVLTPLAAAVVARISEAQVFSRSPLYQMRTRSRLVTEPSGSGAGAGLGRGDGRGQRIDGERRSFGDERHGFVPHFRRMTKR